MILTDKKISGKVTSYIVECDRAEFLEFVKETDTGKDYAYNKPFFEEEEEYVPSDVLCLVEDGGVNFYVLYNNAEIGDSYSETVNMDSDFIKSINLQELFGEELELG